jgi:hypothetical protein
MRLRGSIREWCVAAAALALGCQPNIGDACKIHTDCSPTGNRICEPNLPGGYCTVFNCEPGSCPPEGVCIAYGVAPSNKRECAVQQVQRLERTFCMARCSGQSDCRGGYECIDLAAYSSPEVANATGQMNPWNAAVVDTDRGTKICTVPLSDAARLGTVGALASASSEVCMPPPLGDASFPPVPPAPGTDGGSGDSGSPGVTPGPDAARGRDAAPGASDAAPRLDAAAPDARGAP